jgi:[ribosomal protein S5]-alanine N-acetyltransferase
MDVPLLATERLLVREFAAADLDAVHTLLDTEITLEAALTREERQVWLTWTRLGYRQLARLHQPPYGDRAIVRKEDGRLIGACGYVPVLNALGQIPSLRDGGPERPGLLSAAVGLYYVVSPAYRGQGYATEAVRALINHAFAHMALARIVATTTFDNVASIAVMRRLGMRIERNPRTTPPWLQVVGVLEHPDTPSG